MNTQDIINILRQLGNQSIQDFITPWQKQMICQAQELTAGVTYKPSPDKLLQYAKILSTIKVDGELDKIEFFCFLPATKKKWKVFVVDKFSRILAQLEDYDGEIKEAVNQQGQTQPQQYYPLNRTFLLRYK